MLSWTEEQHVQDMQCEGFAVVLGCEGGNFFIYSSFFPPLKGDSCCSAPARDSPELPESLAEWALEELGKLGSQLESPTTALGSAALAASRQPWLCPCPGSRTSRVHLSQPKDSGCSLSPCLMLPLAWCSPTTLYFSILPLGKRPLCPTLVSEVQAALELLSSCCQPGATTSPSAHHQPQTGPR